MQAFPHWPSIPLRLERTAVFVLEISTQVQDSIHASMFTPEKERNSPMIVAGPAWKMRPMVNKCLSLAAKTAPFKYAQ
jgi:hypothetical protein